MLRGVPPNQPAYSFEKVKVLHSELRPRPLGTVVPQHTKALLERASTFIIKSPGELRMDGPCHIKPCRDPVLRKSWKELIRLLVRLGNQGLLSFRDHIKEAVGSFCVKKKTPEWVRLIVDARMGWSWALYFAQQAVSHIACGRVERPLTEVRDKTPAPDISQQPCVGVYVTVDNIAWNLLMSRRPHCRLNSSSERQTFRSPGALKKLSGFSKQLEWSLTLMKSRSSATNCRDCGGLSWRDVRSWGMAG